MKPSSILLGIALFITLAFVSFQLGYKYEEWQQDTEMRELLKEKMRLEIKQAQDCP